MKSLIKMFLPQIAAKVKEVMPDLIDLAISKLDDWLDRSPLVETVEKLLDEAGDKN